MTIVVKDGNGALQTIPTIADLQATVATQVTLAAADTKLGSVTETAPASDTASSGLNGRMQRLAQRLSSLIALLPTSLGAGGGLRVDGSGTALPVSLSTVPSHAVTNAGTFAAQVDGAALTALQLLDDTVVAPGTALGAIKNSLVGGSVTTAAPTYTNGQVSPLNLDTQGNLRVNVAAGGGSGGTSSTVGAAAPGTGTAVGFSDGTNMLLGRIKAASTAPVATDPAIVVAISPNGQQTGNTTMSASPTVNIASDQGKIPLHGDIAHDATDTNSNPIKIGFKAIAHGTNPTAVTAGDRVDSLANRAGVPFMIGGHPNIISRSVTIADADNAQTNLALVTVATGAKIVVTAISAVCDASNTGNVAVRIGFAAATLPSASTSGAAGMLLEGKFAASGGNQKGNGSGILGVGADGEDLRLTCDDPVGGALYVTCSYYTVES